MVDSVFSAGQAAAASGSGVQADSLSSGAQVERTQASGGQAAFEKSSVVTFPLSDTADISDSARSRLASEKEAMHFSGMASRMEEPFDAEKVNTLKTMLDNGRINDYLRHISNDMLADTLLNSPAKGALLR
jgi:hypothetical protein